MTTATIATASNPSTDRVPDPATDPATDPGTNAAVDRAGAGADRHVDVVRRGFHAVGNGDLAGFAAIFAEHATWNHRNDDRLGGVKTGRDAIVDFLKVSMELTAGTLRAEPGAVLTDEAGHVAVLTRVSATRPDGRDFDDTQMLLFTVDGDLVLSVDQFVGDPARVTAFWA